MKWKRVLSSVLAFTMVVGSVVNAAPLSAGAAERETATNTEADYQDPWTSTSIPHMDSKRSDNVNAEKFTHKEWTGTTYNDADGKSVKAAEVYGINREEASMFATTSVVYDTVDKAIDGAKNYNKAGSKYVQFLTGADQKDWSLVVKQNQTQAQAEAYKDFYKADYNMAGAADWKSGLELPCSWTRQGFDFSIYTNSSPMPWQTDYDNNVASPLAPTNYNPVGLYRKTFKVNNDMRAADGRIYISFQGVEAAYYVYVNGKEVGYSEDSYAPHSFDITDYLNEGDQDNLLAVKVHKFCDGTWMEDQDFYYDGGIFRDVYLYAAPLVHIQDYTVVTDLDDQYQNAEMSISVSLANASTAAASGYKVDARLYDADGAQFVNGVTLDFDTVPAANGNQDGTASAEVKKTVLSPKLWSAETPNLYTLVLSLYDSRTGVYMGSVSQQLGFREIEFVRTEVDENGNRITKDSDYKPITINGKQLMFKGANRHDTDPVYGKYVPLKTQEEDVLLMKQYNLNAIRTSHYSNDEYLYYLCDKYGLYMMAETNMECHDLMNNNNEAGQAYFKKMVMDRTITTFNRLKNRTANVMWSIGNESYYSSRHSNNIKSYADGMYYDLIWYFKDHDLTRPVHSEGSYIYDGVDVGSNMYPSIGTTQSRATMNMPYVMCEYAHGQGNAVGEFKDYWDAVRSSDNMMGGFIWDWVDQSRMLSLDSLPDSYTMAEKAANVTGNVSVNSIDDNPDAAALTGKSLKGYATFNSKAYNEALSGSGKAFTVEVICKPETLGTDQVLLSKGDYQFALKTNSSRKLEFFAYYNNAWGSATADVPANWIGNWHQVAATYNNGVIQIYCDGELLVTKQDGNKTIAASSSVLGVGYDDVYGRTFNGEISMGRIYTKVLSAEELSAQNRANPAIGAEDECVLLWADMGDVHVDESEQPYDYYAEDFAHENLYDAAGHFYGYGGDSGENPHSGTFCVNGLVSPDRDVQPELYQVKYIYQSIWFDATEIELLNGKVNVYNEYNFLNLNDFTVKWELLEDDKVIASGNIADVSLAGRERGSITVPFISHMPARAKAGAEYYLNLSVQLKEDTLWAKAGYEVSYEQFSIPAGVKNVEPKTSGEVQVKEEDDNTYLVEGTGAASFSFRIDKATGTIRDYVYDGETLLAQGPVPNYWRATRDNNETYDRGWFDTGWQNVNESVTADVVTGTNEDGQAVITVDLHSEAQPDLVQKMVYTVDGSGAIRLEATVDGTKTSLGRYKRIGTVMELPAGFENVEWYGNGEVESYSDRQDFARVGRYSATVSKMFYPFLFTQDTGNMTGTKWFTVTNPQASGALAIAAKDTVEVSALHFSVADMEQADHPYALHPKQETFLTVNHISMGAGNEIWGAGFLSKDLVDNDKAYTYEYTIIPYHTQDEAGAKADVMELTRPYRTVDTSSEADIIAAEANALIEKIDSILVSSGETDYLVDMKKAYEGLPEMGKAMVTEARYEKVLEAIALAEQIKNGEVSLFVRDKSQNGYDITVSAEEHADLEMKDGIATMTGYTAVKGEGANDKMNNIIGGTKPFTVEAVINPNDYGYGGGDYNNTIFSKGDGCAALRISGQSVYFFIKNSSNQWVDCTIKLTPEQMKSKLHIAGIYDGSKVTTYLEGQEVASKTAGTVAASNYPFGIGYCPEKNRTTNSNFYSLRLYSKALTKEELDDGAYAANDENVQLWYDFNDYVYQNVNAEATGIRSYTSSLKLTTGETAQIQAELVPYYASGKIVYSSADEAVATVDAKGVVTAVAKGSTTITAAIEGDTDKKVTIPVTVNAPIAAPSLSYAAPAGNTVPRAAEITDIGDGKILDRTEDGVEFTARAGSPEAVVVNQDGVWGFNGQLTTQSGTDKFNVYGSAPLLFSFKLFAKAAPTGPLNLFGKMDNQYGIQLDVSEQKPCLQAYYNNGNSWPTLRYTLPANFYGKWHDVLVAFDGKGNIAIFIDGEGNAMVNQALLSQVTGQKFTIGYNPSKANQMPAYQPFTAEQGYLADLKMYKADVTDIVKNGNTFESMNDYATICSLLADEEPAANITVVPYAAETVWKTADGAVLKPEDTFEEGSDYTAITTLTAYGNYKFDNSSEYIDTVLSQIQTGAAEGANAEAACEVSADRKSMTVTVTYKETGASTCTCEISEIRLTDQSVKIEAGQETATITLAPEAVISGDCAIEGHPNNAAFTYSVKNGADVADVDAATGVVTAKKAGEATITVVATLAKDGEETTTATKDIKVTVSIAGVGEVIEESPAISYVAPGIGKAPMGAGVTVENMEVADRAEDPVTLVQKEGSDITIESTDDVYGFAGQFATDSDSDKFDVYGSEAMVLRFKLYIKKQAPTSSTDGNEKNINILGKMNNQYGFQISPTGIILYMENANGQWPQHGYTIDKSFYKKWHDIAIWVNGKGEMGFYVDGEASTNDRPSNSATAKHTSDHFTLGYNWNASQGAQGILTSEYGYLADVQLFRGEDLTTGMAEVTDYQSLTDVLAQLRANAMITALPYSFSTVWSQTGSGEALGKDAVFEAGKLYTATTTFTAYGDGIFENSDTFKAEVKSKLTGIDNADANVSISEDGRTMTVTVDFKDTKAIPCTCEIESVTQADQSVDLKTEKTVVLNPSAAISEDCNAGGHPLSPEDVVYTYEVTAGADVAEVAADGTVTAKKAGEATITITATLARSGSEAAVLTKEVKVTVTDEAGNLEAAIRDANERIAGDKEKLYTEDSVRNLKDQITKAQNILADASSTKKQVTDAIRAVENAAGKLRLQEDLDKEAARNALSDAIGNARQIVETQNKDGIYTKDSFDKLSSAFAAAEAAYNKGNDATVEELVKALQDLQNSMKLSTNQEVAKAELTKVITAADSIYAAGAAGYTEASWKAFADAYTAAKTAAATADAATLNALADALAKAQAGLVKADAPVAPTLKKGDPLTKNGITFKVISPSKKTVTVSKVKSSKKSITIPATVTIKGVSCKVVQIDAKAFSGLKKLRTVVIGKNVTKIGKQAFANCQKLSTVTVKGTGIKSIGQNAFKKTASKVTVKVPKSMKKSQRTKLLNQMKKKGLSKRATIKTGK